jgi:Esterase-like activity of phytase
MLLGPESPLRLLSAVLLAVAIAAPPSIAGDHDDRRKVFNRIATFPVFLNLPAGADPGTETVAEIVAASEDGTTLIYTDGATGSVGFVDITDPTDPEPLGLIPVDGAPTSVAVAGPYAIVGVDTSPDLLNPSGFIAVIDIATRMVVRDDIDAMGQPDSVAVSPSGKFAAVAIENQRDEGVVVDGIEGGLPQPPPGFLLIIDLDGPPANWSARRVELSDLAGCTVGPSDPEPEFVDIRPGDVAAVSLQENNCIALVRLKSGRVLRSFDAGATTIDQVDTADDNLITLTETIEDVAREPDAIAWIRGRIATANEGDLVGGSRGFGLFNQRGRVVFDAGNRFEHETVRLGQYPDDRSDNKGSEPEGIEAGRFSGDHYLFVGSERANVIGVYEVTFGRRPKLLQFLPTGAGPEGLLAIPHRGLFVVGTEVDDRSIAIRASITLYELQDAPLAYPTVQSTDSPDGTPIPWSALSALAADRKDADKIFTVYDSAFTDPRIFVMNVEEEPAVIEDAIVLTNGTGEPLEVDELDLEGLVQRADGSFWAVSEGAGTVGDPEQPVETANLLLRIAADGTILERVELPAAVNALQVRFGFEGVAVTGEGGSELVYVAFQREWAGDPDNMVRIGRYDPNEPDLEAAWTFFHLEIKDPSTPNPDPGFVGLSEIVAIDDETLAVVQRDDQGGTDARIKEIVTFSIAGLTPLPQPAAGVPGFPTVAQLKTVDLIPALMSLNGPVLEKVEGLTIGADGEVYFVTDNDAVSDATGETQFMAIGGAADILND